MWPILLDMTKDECKRSLRRLELEAYGNIVSALRAQGGLTTDKNKLLQDVASTLNIPQERHRAEVRRAVNDERLATIAHCMTGDDSSDEWALEGRRLIPLMPRLAPQTAYSVIADDEANKVSLENEKLPLPANTERKRPLQTSTTETLNKNVSHRERDVHFRMPSESSSKSSMQKINMDEIVSKKRKSSMNMESSSLAQHLMMAQPKLSRVQQLYRQKTKAILKSQMKQRPPPPIPQIQKMNVMKHDEESNNSNSIQEVPIQQHQHYQHQHQQITSLPKQQIENKIINQVTIATSETQTLNTKSNKPTIISTTIIKPGNTSTNANANNTNNINNNNNINNTNNSSSSSSSNNNNTIIPQQPVVSSSTSSEVAQHQQQPQTQPKSIKICPARKVITTSARTPTTPQKVIIVSTPQGQGTTNPSILQRTLSSIPFMKTISMKSLDKVKVINSPNLQNISSTNTGVSGLTTQKPKLLTVQTKTKGGTPGKQVSIPFIQGVQLQALQNKGAIKMLPLTTQTKGTSKPTIISTTAGSVYIMNSNTTLPIVTSSNTTPVVTTKTESKNNNDVEVNTNANAANINSNSNIIILKNELIKPATPVKNKTELIVNPLNSENSLSAASEAELKKSSVLAEILKASGVIPNDYSDPNDNDIESQISQLTEIPNANSHINTTINNNNNNNNNNTTTTTTTTPTTTTNINIINKQNLKTDEIELKSEYLEEEIITNENIEIIMKNDNVQIDIKNEHLAHELTNEHFQSIIHENCQNETEVHFDETEMDVSQDSANYVILQENEDHTETIIMDENTETEEVVELMGSLDPETGMYSMKTPQEYELIDQVVSIETSQSDSQLLATATAEHAQSQIVHTTSTTHQLPPDSYIIEMQMESLHSSDLDMPSLSN